MERVISKHDCPFYDNEREHVRGNGVNWNDYSQKRGPPSIDYICKLRQKTTSSFFTKNVPKTLLGSKKKQTVFPRVKLANKFNAFFLSIIQNILKSNPPGLVDLKIPVSGDFLETFENVDNLYVVLVRNQVSSKSQPSRNVPSRILKKLSFFYNQMSEIINDSFLNAVFPTAFKHGIVIPIF